MSEEWNLSGEKKREEHQLITFARQCHNLPSIVLLPSVSASEDSPFCNGGGGDGRVGWSGVLGVSDLGDKGEDGTIPFTLSAQLFPGLENTKKNI